MTKRMVIPSHSSPITSPTAKPSYTPPMARPPTAKQKPEQSSPVSWLARTPRRTSATRTANKFLSRRSSAYGVLPIGPATSGRTRWGNLPYDLRSRQPPLVCPDALFVNAQNPLGDTMALTASDDGGCSGGLCLAKRRHFLCHHAARFGLAVRGLRRHAHDAKRH